MTLSIAVLGVAAWLTPPSQAASCSLTVGQPYRSSEVTTVYVITPECQKRPIFNPDVYFSHFSSWSDVRFIERADIDRVQDHPLRFLPWGPRRVFENGSLIKTTDDPRVYLLLNGTIYPFDSETAFRDLGYDFSQIEDVTSDVMAKYSMSGSSIRLATDAPASLVFKYADSPRVYRLEYENSRLVKRYIRTIQELRSYGRADRISILPSSQTFPDAETPAEPSQGDVEVAMIGRCQVFLSDNAWNTDISSYPVHPNSENYLNNIGKGGHLHPDFGTEWAGQPIGIPYAVVDGISKVPINFTAYSNESDPGPYPIPANAEVEGGATSDGDRHVLVVDESDCKLYELYRAFSQNNGASWNAGSGAVWDLTTNDTRPDGWTSADAAGLPILPGLVRYDEVIERGVIPHALRFTVSKTQNAYIAPASHYASNSSDSNRPPMGLRLRMKASYDCSNYSSEVQVICTALKKYGMIVADNGSDWYVSGAHDDRWSDERLGDLKDIPGSAFEVVQTQ